MSGDDQEVLDWGNEDDELQVFDSNGLSEMKLGVDSRSGGEQEDDAVSLGDDEDEDIYPYRPASQDETITDPPSTPRGSGLYHNGADKGRDIYRESSITSQKSSRRNDSPSFQRTQSFGKMVHALPPKPVVALPPPAHSPPTQNTRASAMVRRERRSNGHAKHDSDSREASSLPPDWEERYPRNGSDRGPYYFNTKTQTATWQHPGTSSATGTNERNKDNDVASRDDLKFSAYNRSEEDHDASTRREGKRRSSPVGPLSYEDRHYRPSEDTVTTGSSQSIGRRSVYSALPPRPISPRLADDRRVSRASSPPRRRDDQERGVRSRGDRSPLPDDRNGRRDKLQEYPELSPDDRTWVARRSDSPPPPLTDRIADNRSKTSRGRRDRSNPEPPPQPASVSQGVRNDNEWSASRPRSPAHRVREPSPPRRYPDVDTYIRRSSISPPRQRNRIERSLSRDRSNATSSYEPGGIPQRRAREEDTFYDVEAKRRRTDYSPVELVKERDYVDARDSRADYNAGSSMTDTVESSRPRKRQPLPPQSTRFREASKKPVLPEPTLPPPSTQHSGVTRSQPSQSHRDPPTGPSGRDRNRGDNGIRQARESDIMDVDQQPLSRPVPSRAVPSRNTDRVNGSPNVLPTAPRAMGKVSGQSYPPTPPHTTQELNWRRPLPPHLQDTSASVTSSIPNAPSRSDRSSRRATGSNNTPLGEKYPEQPRLDIPSAPIADRSRQQPTPTHLEAERARRADDYNKTSSRSASYQSASPIDRVKILPPVNEPTSRWPAREETRNGKDRGSPPPSNLPTSRPSLPQKDHQQPSVSERGPRVSRFGPERVQVPTVVEAESRQWLTREEAERSGLVNSVGRNTNVRPPTPPPVASRDRRRADSDSNRYATDRRYHSPEDHVDHSSHNERPSLEGRLSRERDSSFTGRPPSPVISRRGGRQSEQNGITHERRDVTRGYRDDDVVRSAQSDYPPAKQGTTLLDRLTEPSYDSAPSLRERVNPLVSGIASLPPRPAMEVSLAAGEEGSKGDRGPRRRNGGRRKGRR